MAQSTMILPFLFKANSRIISKDLLGYLPRTSNTEIAQLLEMGWATIFECRISKINEDAHYENQIRLTIRIKQNQQAQNCVES